MSSVQQQVGVILLGMDVHKNTISVGVLEPDREDPIVSRISSDPQAVALFIERLGDPARLSACYEAGPTGYELARQLAGLGVSCEVIAPSMIPTAPGDRIKTDARDCRRLARLHRAGQLVAIRIPSPAEEGVRDLCRARADMIIDQTVPATDSAGSCSVTAGSGAVGTTGRESTWPGSPHSPSTIRPPQQPSRTTGPLSRCASRRSHPSKLRLPDGSAASRSQTMLPGWVPTAASRRWGR